MQLPKYVRYFNYSPAAVGTTETGIVKLAMPAGTLVTHVAIKSLVQGDTDAVITVGDGGSATRYINQTNVGAAGTITDTTNVQHAFSTAGSIQCGYTKGATPTTAPQVKVMVEFTRAFPQ